LKLPGKDKEKLPTAGGQTCSRWEGEKIKPRP